MTGEKPVILLTNDDGIRSPGLIAAAEALESIGELWVAAPDRQQTSAGRSFPIASSGIIRGAGGFPAGVRAFSVEGSPAQCICHAVLDLMPEKPAIVVSGINSGVNVGIDITRSGTVGAALEAAGFGIPALAVSLEIHQREVFAAEPNADFSAAADFTARFARKVLAGVPGGDTDLLKIDVPGSAGPDTDWEITRLSRKSYYRVFAAGRGKLGWNIETDLSSFERGTDVHTVFVRKMVSVTPLSLDMTSRADLPALEGELRRSGS